MQIAFCGGCERRLKRVKVEWELGAQGESLQSVPQFYVVLILLM